MNVFRDGEGREESSPDDSLLVEWAAELADRVRAGEPVDLGALSRQHPERAGALRRLVPAIALMADLGSAARRGAADLDPFPAGPDPADERGRLGDYRLIREVGRGGMGIVYEAEQISLGRRVALKVLPFAAALDPRQLQRFHVEAQAAAFLHHTHIVAVHAVGCERGVHYYAMQFIEGRTLAEVIRELRRADGLEPDPLPRPGSAVGPAPVDQVASWLAGKLTAASLATTARQPSPLPGSSPDVSGPSRSDRGVPEASAVPAADEPAAPRSGSSSSARSRAYFRGVAALGRQAAEALEHAHRQGVLHRDIKPANLMLDGRGHLWITDFGLARFGTDSGLTLTGDVLGTLRYMSPEQALAGRVLIDHRTDIYSLGLTLYELLALRPAFEGQDRAEILRRIAEEEPKPLRRLNSAVPCDLETIVRKAIDKDPAGRYATAAELAGDLRRFLESRPIQARRPSLADRAAKWARRHKSAVAAAALVVLAVLMGLGGAAVWRNGVLRRHNRELRRALELAEQNESSTRRLWYDSQLRLAQQASASGQVEFAQEILEGLRPESSGRDLRGFEWHYLHRVCHRDVSVLTAHDSSSMIVSPDGRTLISGDRYGSILVWNLSAGRELIRFQGHRREVCGLMISPDGRALLSWSSTIGEPSEVKLWDPGSARQLAAVPGVNGYAEALAFAPGGRALVILEHAENPDSAENKLVFWNLAPGLEHLRPGRPSIPSDWMDLSRDGRWLATGMVRGTTVTLRDAATGEPIRTLSKRFPGMGGIVFSPDGQTVAAHSPGVTIWETRSGRELGSLPGLSWSEHAFSPDGSRLAGITAARDKMELITDVTIHPRLVPLEAISAKDLQMAFSPDGKTLAGGGARRSATLWNTSSGRKIAECPGETGMIGRPAFAPDGESLIFGGEDGRIRSWHFVKKPEPLAQLAGHTAEVWGLAYTPDGTSLISAADDHSIKIWDPLQGALRSTLTGHAALVASLAISSDGELLASGSFDKTVRLWDLVRGQPRAVFRGHTDRVRAVAFSPDRRHLASAGSDKTVRIWDVERGEPIVVFPRHTDTVRALAFDPTGALVVSSSDDRTIRGIDVKRDREVFSLACPNHNSALAFSADGSVLASADDRGNLTIWEVATWTRRRSVKGADAGIWGLCFSPDGRTLAAACGDGKVRLWDPITGQVMLVLEGHAQRVNAVAFAPDGATLASASHDGAIRLWRSSP